MTTPQHDDGGPAFPCVINEEGGGYNPETKGMTLRDWFAGQALPPFIHMCATDENIKEFLNSSSRSPSAFSVKMAYRVADAMLAARKKAL